MPTLNQGSMSMSVSEAPDPVWENKQFLLKLIMEQLKITNEDLRDTSIVRTKVRESKIETLLLG